MLKRLVALGVSVFAASTFAMGEGEQADPISPSHPWHFAGLTGQHDIAQVQRGFQVFWAKCAACHGMEFRRFWHLEHIGYTEPEIRIMINEVLTGQGLTFDTSTYSIQNLPASRVANAPDLSHAVLANGKTMEQGADYIFSLLLGYDRDNDAVLGAAVEVDLQTDDTDFVQVGEPVEALNVEYV